MDIFQDLKILLHPADLARIFSIRRAVTERVGRLSAEAHTSREPVPFERRAENTRPVRRFGKWGDMFDCAWFRFTGKVPDGCAGKRLCAVLNVWGEGLVVDGNGEPLQGITNPCSVANVADFLNVTPGKSLYFLDDSRDVDFWMDCGFNGVMGKEMGAGRLLRADLAVYREDVAELYYDFLALAFAKILYRGRDRADAARALSKAYVRFVRKDIAGAREALRPCLDKPSETDLTLTAVGHSHLDLAWLWPIRETKRKSARTVSTALKNMDLFGSYVYGASQPQQFAWMKENHPGLYERAKAAVREGRLEPQGGMWCECDTNLTGAESLVRQFLYGMEFWEKEFGFKVNNCWIPDVFGYTAALPGIMRGFGINYFMTQKLSWNDYNEFPYGTFMWEGTSDERVLAHLLPANTYSSSVCAPSLDELRRNHERKDVIPEALMLYGAGDGGGGPAEVSMALCERYADLKGLPKIKCGRACDFFERMAKYEDRLPVHKGELYLEKHQGTFTVHADVKKMNRKNELALHDLEVLGAAALSKGYPYPFEKIKDIWKETMLYQFHDILPGSSIARVYAELIPRCRRMQAETAVERDACADFLKTGEGLSAVNTAPFSRREYVKHDGKWYLLDMAPYESVPVTPAENVPDVLRAGKNFIENDILKAVFGAGGEIVSLTDKKTGTEFNGKYLNRLTVYTDKKTFYDAWDIDIDYPKRRKSRFRPVETKTYVDGARAVCETRYEYGHSRILQKTILHLGRPYVEFNTRADWHETHRMLRADFIPKHYGDEVVCDIQFGNIRRSTRTDNAIDRARFEIPAHKYIDVSTGGFGAAILSSSKYGFRAKDGLMNVNLLRSPTYPDRTADRGMHHFRYAYYPHAGDCFEAEVPKQAYLFNYAPVFENVRLEIPSLASADRGNVVIETIKPAEDGKGVAVRAFENEGRETECTLSFNLGYDRVYLSDMRENVLGECPERVTFKPYEIKTFLLR